MPEPNGPWDFPPPPKAAAAPRRRPTIGLIIWLALLAAGGVTYWGLTQLFPSQVGSADKANALFVLGLMAIAACGLVLSRRVRLGEAMRNMAIWFAIGAVALVGYSFRDELGAVFQRVRGDLTPGYAVPTSNRSMVLTAADDGHFYVEGQVNGAPVKFIIDTGSTGVVLAPADAQRAGVDLASLKFASPGETANGVGYDAETRVSSLAVGPLRLADVEVEVNKAPMSASLLGMTFLRQVDITTHGDQMTLKWRS